MNGPARSRGVSLIEALVALAVMAFGLLGVVGMQSTLRFNADVSRQRAEAVRMAQEKMEDLRSFGVLSGSPAGEHDYAKIAVGTTTDSPTPPAGFSNTAFTRTTTVTAGQPRMKTVVVSVGWLDRRTQTGAPQETVTLTSTIAQIAPEIGASLGLPGDRSPAARPRGRHPAIPPAAVNQPGGTTSIFTPPNAGGRTWTFVNATGQITSLCPAAGVCTAVTGWLLSGTIQFAHDRDQPDAAWAEDPQGDPNDFPTIGVQVSLTVPVAPLAPWECFTRRFSLFVSYYCFVPTDTSPAVWSGSVTLTGMPIATDMADFNDNSFKVCRYTPDASHTPAGGNPAHPLVYTLVNSSLANQNYLVMRAGNNSNGGTPYTCPGDGPNPLINSNTFPHQPSA